MIYVITIILIGFIIFIIELYKNENPKLTKYEFEELVTKEFEKKEIRILQISDLHNHSFGKNQNRLMKLIENKYDYIFITGDLVDRRYTKYEPVEDLIRELSKLDAEIFFVKGNHEKGIKDLSKLYAIFDKYGIKHLSNCVLQNNEISIIGLDDASEYETISKKYPLNENKIIDERLKNIKFIDENIKILLSHDPIHIDVYKKHKMNYVFSGHTHGGQVRLFGYGLYASGQGFFGKYSGGIFKEEETLMINSRGLGNNFFFAKRIFNQPEIIDVKIKFKCKSCL